MAKNESSHFFQLQDMEVMKLDESDLDVLQGFLNNSDDFFILCEGVKGSAAAILTACPPAKDLAKDKLCLGVFENGALIGFLDLIKNHPADGTLVIGYFLVHPEKRSKGIGTHIIVSLSHWAIQQSFSKLRLCVQRQNPRALDFWVKNGFKIVDTIIEKLGHQRNETDILELAI